MIKRIRQNGIAGLFREFYESEKAGGLILIVCVLISLILANATFGERYIHIWHISVAGMSIESFINDGLMAIFFLLVGLELQREFHVGEFAVIRNAFLPMAGALGGMIVPALLFTMFNFGTETQSGAGIPMATDIAFAIGVLSLLGKRVPASLKVFLTALAVIDDLGAIIVIALLYSKGVVIQNLLIVFGVYVILIALNKLKVRSLIPYLIGGGVMWYFMHHSGIHATITGVLLAFVIPFGKGDEVSPAYKLEHSLTRVVPFIILPLFALANTAIVLNPEFTDIFTHNYNIGIATGLIIGKPLGIALFSYLAVAFGLCALPKELNWKMMIGVGFLGGIGFTMSIFITLLAFDQTDVIANAKLTILVSSLIAGIIGLVVLKRVLR